jgi:outer membrane lipoprotein carrier protein
MRNLIYILFFITFHQQVISQTVITETEALTFKNAVIKTANSTQSIVSDFEQYKHLSFLNNKIKTVGKLVFKTPNLIKWEYTKPYKYTAIFKENSLFIDDEGSKNTIDIGSNKMFKSFNKLIINSVKGNMFNDNEFTIRYYKYKENYLVNFIPKDQNMRNFIASFELTFNIKTADVIAIKMIEPSEDYTEILFKNKKKNTTVSDEVFN